MSYRKRYITNTPRNDRPTARRRIVSTLTTEILGNNSGDSFLLGSEYQLCRRFKVSRVTIRLALDDLKNDGLVFRKHGIGTFAYGLSNRIQRHIGIVLDISTDAQIEEILQFLRGVQTYARGHRAAVIITDHAPQDWRPEFASMLSGVIILLEEVSSEDVASLQNRELPYLILGRKGVSLQIDQCPAHLKSRLPTFHPSSDFFLIGQQTAQILSTQFDGLESQPPTTTLTSTNLSAESHPPTIMHSERIYSGPDPRLTL